MAYSFTRIFLFAGVIFTLMIPQAKADMPVGVIDLTKIIETSAAGKDLQAKFKARKESVRKRQMPLRLILKAKSRL